MDQSTFRTRPSGGGAGPPDPDGETRAGRNGALAILVAFALARIAFTFSLGLGVDEAYTLAISRRLSWSYFDHPPLHLWIAHFSALALGEGPAARLPFVALFAATGWLTFALTRNLFGARAGLIALFALNATPFFFASAGAWIVPDGPLVLSLAAAALAFERLVFGGARAWPSWLAAGVFLGLAGLSKYNAVFVALGFVLFLALAPRWRRWFARLAPYVAALLALALIAPVLSWNAHNGWASFLFQGGRGAPDGRWRPLRVGAMALGEIALLSPWIFAGLAGALAAALRAMRGPDGERRLFLLCLSLPSIVVFTLTPLWGAKGLPHWPMPGWLFVYPLLGAWLAGASRRRLRLWAAGSAALLALLVVLVVGEASQGWLARAVPRLSGGADPTLQALDWSALRASPLLGADSGAAFVVATKWSSAGKIAMALGPRTPVLVFSDDPRGFAFLDDSGRFIGKDGVVIVETKRLASALSALRPYFADLGAPQLMSLGRAGMDEIDLALIPAHNLLRAYPLPYPPRPASAR